MGLVVQRRNVMQGTPHPVGECHAVWRRRDLPRFTQNSTFRPRRD